MINLHLSHATGSGTTAEIDIPQLGLGVYQASAGGEAEQAVLWALEAGYRHIDTAAVYHNESDVGRAIGKSGISREEFHVTTKLWSRGHGYDAALNACDKSLERLGLDFVDLYLVHAPPAPELRPDTWRAMERLLSDGKTRAIGVSNYGQIHLDEMLDYAEVMPCTNQIEMSPYLQRPALAERCKALGIVVTAYSPLTKGEKLKDAKLVEIASAHNKSTAQVLIRWSIQMGYLVIPKSVKKARLHENIAVQDFALSEKEMRTMSDFDENYITAWDPTTDP